MARFAPKVYGDSHEHGGSRKQEARIAKATGGHQQAGSGASQYAKGDIKAEHFLIEAKTTEAASLRIEGSWLSKITKEALAVHKMPALAFEIAGYEDPLLERDWVAVPRSTFLKFVDMAKEQAEDEDG